ncbi:hypothetical protein Pmani_033725 [Petrolisthes manimaculis]|uniref:Cadherin domain-containing protein n=1 Tax=Petrolisthes manimaculis TaxID=1843537 RepID=A0AAE1TSF2_9EUCA|nr:hypothetical protein Pmani_033725 [Petrolisthes manimaculis]
MNNITISGVIHRGTSVIRVQASDRDDPAEGLNARLTYSLERNVVESSGLPIFEVDTELGLVTTALCCLDREQTDHYTLHVVATDGGGLKGKVSTDGEGLKGKVSTDGEGLKGKVSTDGEGLKGKVSTDGGGLKGTVTVEVEVEDVNDEPPRFPREEWRVEVEEEQPPLSLLASLSVLDPDVTNDFAFRVVPGSGRGWQMFTVEGRGGTTTTNNNNNNNNNSDLEKLRRNEQKIGNERINNENRNEEGNKRRNKSWGGRRRKEGRRKEVKSEDKRNNNKQNETIRRKEEKSEEDDEEENTHNNDKRGNEKTTREKKRDDKDNDSRVADNQKKKWNKHEKKRLVVVDVDDVDDSDNNDDDNEEEDERKGRSGSGVRMELRALEILDYENSEHRLGFRFRVEVTDRGGGGWREPGRVASTWVNLHLSDRNDHPPVFKPPVPSRAPLTLPEDAPRGTLLATVAATDTDAGGEGQVHYQVAPSSDPEGVFRVDESGSVRVWGQLDRETTPTHTLLIWAHDEGDPPRTATATVSIEVMDVNDNPPYLLKPHEVWVRENGGAGRVCEVKLGDPDDWSRGHGPPFTMALDHRAPPHVIKAINLIFDPSGDAGRGSGMVWTKGPLDREERRALLVPIVAWDAAPAPRTASLTLTLHVADQDDNTISPGAKRVTVRLAQGVEGDGSGVPVGRVHVMDPDDTEGPRKYRWHGAPHPSFSLHPTTGTLTMLPSTPLGRYDLNFQVREAVEEEPGGWEEEPGGWVEAKVRVEVDRLTPLDLTSPTPVTITVPPHVLVSRDEVLGTSIVERMEEAMKGWVSEGNVRVVSVQERNPYSPHHHHPLHNNHQQHQQQQHDNSNNHQQQQHDNSNNHQHQQQQHHDNSNNHQHQQEQQHDNSNNHQHQQQQHDNSNNHQHQQQQHHDNSNSNNNTGQSKIRLNVQSPSESSLDHQPNLQDTTTHTPTSSQVWFSAPGVKNLKHILAYRREEVSRIVGVGAVQVGVGSCQEEATQSSNMPSNPDCSLEASSVRDGVNGVSVIDAGTTAFVSPKISVGCVCPHGTWGSHCKILTRHFLGTQQRTNQEEEVVEGDREDGSTSEGGWALVDSIPPCSHVHITLEFLTDSPDATLLYSGPDHLPPPPQTPPQTPPPQTPHTQTPHTQTHFPSITHDPYIHSGPYSDRHTHIHSDSYIHSDPHIHSDSYVHPHTHPQTSPHHSYHILSSPLASHLRHSNTFPFHYATHSSPSNTFPSHSHYAFHSSPSNTFPSHYTSHSHYTFHSPPSSHLPPPRSPPYHNSNPPPPSTSQSNIQSDVIFLELRNGRPSLLLDLGGGPVTLAIPASPSLADLTWHRIDLIWRDETPTPAGAPLDYPTPPMSSIPPNPCKWVEWHTHHPPILYTGGPNPSKQYRSKAASGI